MAEANDRISEAVSMAERSDVVFLCLGLDARLEGEEGDANNSYAGADKIDLEFPDSQKALMEAVCGTGKPVVFLISTGSAMNLSYAKEHGNAILQTWYPGQMGGIAAANLLFGKAVPSGRLPVTFYLSAEDLPPFEDYGMANRTYRYMRGEALYPFGYGLSYGNFLYRNLQVETGAWDRKDSVKVSVQVTNDSSYDCDEIVQVYIKLTGSRLAVPNAALAQFRRVSLKAGETKEVVFDVKTVCFQVVDEEGERLWAETDTIVYAGGSQPDRVSVLLTGKKPLETEIKAADRFVG